MYKTGEGQPKERDKMWNYTNTQQTLKPFTIYLFLARARIYVIYFLKKAFTPSHTASKQLIFSDLRCEHFAFQAFTRHPKHSHMANPVKDGEFNIFYCFTYIRPGVKGWKCKCSQAFPMEISNKRPVCERVNAFFGYLMTYIRARARGWLSLTAPVTWLGANV